MGWFNNLRIGARLIAGFLVVASLSIVVGAIGLRNMGKIDTDVSLLYDRDVKAVIDTLDAESDFLLAGRAFRDAMLAPSEELRMQSISAVKSSLKTTKDKIDGARPLFWTEKGKALLTEFDGKWANYVKVADRLYDIVSNEKPGNDPSKDAARVLLFGDYKNAVLETQATFVAMQENKRAAAEAINDSNDALYKASVWWMSAAMGMAVVLGLALGLWITRSITTPIHEAVKVARTVAAGDLTSNIVVTGKDETAELLAALQEMNAKLVEIVSQVRQSSDSIATGSAQIAAGNSDLSQRTEEQSSNLEETAASMEELTSTVKTNADTASQATHIANAAAEAATHGGEVVGKVVRTMEEIAESSKKISDIIGVIDGIAFQTNILALNAAVEAARAGEQGRGFAVVASEVRSLAQRSAGAAKEIKELINDSVARVEAGTHQVNEAGTSMQGIVNQVNSVNQLIGEISGATREQSSGIAQVGDAVNQLDQVTQQNAALVEQSAAAADSLKHQAEKLIQAVSIFKLSVSASNPSSMLAASTNKTHSFAQHAHKVAAPQRPAPKAPTHKAVRAAVKPSAPAHASGGSQFAAPVRHVMAAGAVDPAADWESF
jgi:methyl-accepting chemotaxis protein